MRFGGSKVLAIEIVLAFTIAPLVVWLALLTFARQWPVALRPIVPWMRLLRWVCWILGLALVVAYLVFDLLPLAYGIAFLTFSLGLSIPENWAKRRLAAEIVESDPLDGSWPRKHK